MGAERYSPQIPVASGSLYDWLARIAILGVFAVRKAASRILFSASNEVPTFPRWGNTYPYSENPPRRYGAC
jgi:hypothetical protein